ncbi:hypothetical protein AGMMS50276_03640 [Synergistales bacterium]|nr:hypothetical protein AGMMS50276_03640 [Synergistales bacterium]
MTTVTYGETERIIVTFMDGSVKQITRAEIAEYADESNNKNNAKEVKWIEVETPNSKLRDGLVYVDTPGIGSLNPLHTEATLAFLPRADVALFVSDATVPLTETELNFLRSVRRFCQNFIFLLTKVDARAEYERILEANRKKIAEYTDIQGDKILYIPVAAEIKLAGVKEGDEELIASSNIELLEETLWNAVEENRENIIFDSALRAIEEMLGFVSEQLRMRAVALSSDKDAQDKLRDELQQKRDKLTDLRQDTADWLLVINDSKVSLSNDVQEIISNLQTNAQGKLAEMLRSASTPTPGDVLNAITLMVANTHASLMDCVGASVENCIDRLERTTELNLRNGVSFQGFREAGTPEFHSKVGVIDKALHVGRNVMMNSAGGATVGSIFGGLVGGFFGSVVPGPGTLGGALVGAKLGAATGGAVGWVWGLVKGIRTNEAEDMLNLQTAANNYINATVHAWQNDFRRSVSDIYNSLRDNLRSGLKQLEGYLQNEAASLADAIRQDADTHAKAVIKYKAVRTDFGRLDENYRNLLG